ncbi:MAG: hydroxymethylbilane synthase [Pelagibacterales bacterium]|nr:hydroxymethylbilane synthase [Pelagibacterales bacterium]PPR15973.1 MAG: Porphobilinogen deaminase [Alphaproteobacteria bacterium MarineAlpha9_Bin3]|tara:strand:- start:13057 stop:13959 length:903 start_codon:yes stop_codon:yes gene_type:complete
MSDNNILKVGTRGSPLALWQAYEVKKLLNNVKIIKIKTTGDKITNKPLSSIGGKGLFTKEIDKELINENIDIAVHSLKDVPTIIPDKFNLTCILPRGEAEDVLISNNNAKNINSLPLNSTIGTSSPRRHAQIKRIRPDIKIFPIRGNINTRLKKVKNKEVFATILALAGIKRLNVNTTYSILNYAECMPAASQGIIGITYLKKNFKIKEILDKLLNQETNYQALGERAVLLAINGDCHSPIAVTSSIEKNKITIFARIFTLDGKRMIEDSKTDIIKNAETLGNEIGRNLIRMGALSLLKL